MAGVVALTITAARPVVVIGLPDMDFPRGMALVAFVSGATCMLAVLSNIQILFQAACAIIAVIFAAMIFESLFQFVTARPLFIERNHLIWHWFRISTTGLVTNFVVYMAYRNASWRLGRAVVA